MFKTSLLTLALLLAAMPAQANIDRIHQRPGTSCAIGYGEDQLLYWEDGGIYSAASTWWRTALCPLTLDYEFQTSRILLVVYDRSYDLDVNCRVTTSYSGTTRWGTAATTTGSSPNQVALALGATEGTFMGPGNVLCYLPQTFQGNRSGIVRYEFTGRGW